MAPSFLRAEKFGPHDVFKNNGTLWENTSRDF